MTYSWAIYLGNRCAVTPKTLKEEKPMEKDIREKIALKRFQIISPVLAEPKRAQNEYFRQQAEAEHDFPHYGRRKLRVSTLKAWLRKYRHEGLEALQPQS